MTSFAALCYIMFMQLSSNPATSTRRPRVWLLSAYRADSHWIRVIVEPVLCQYVGCEMDMNERC